MAHDRRVRNLSYIDRQKIHGWLPDDRAWPASNDGVQLFVVTPFASRIAIRVSDRYQGQSRRPLRCPAVRIGDGFAGCQPDDLDDASMELDHWKHRIVGARCGIDAVERRVRSNEIAMSLRLHDDGGRVGDRGRYSLIEEAWIFHHQCLMVGSFVEII